ncbi:MAG: hypothetical protein IPM77_18820 [Crocinitomicaceae bacterium]|nr:hypothetical protein [Crocinitomicaceae bacterium]
MKNITSSIIIGLFLGLFAVSAYGQTLSNPDVSISYTNPNNLKACGNNDTLVILVTNITALPFDAGSVLDVQLPVGISVVSFNSADYTFLTYNSLTNTYSYSMSSTQAAGSFSKIKLELSATCDIFDLLDNTSGNTLDVVADLDFNYSIGGSPGILSGSTLSFNIAQANIKTTVSAFNLTITVPNDYDPFSQEVRYDVSGNSDLDQFFLYFELPAGLTFNQIDSVIVNGVNLSGFVNPTLISGSTYGTDLNASALGLADFSSGDVIFVYYNFSPECLTSVQLSYYSGIDCFGLPCYFDNDLGYVNLLQAPPVIDLDVLFTSTGDYCNNTSEVSLTLVNADISGYTMYNPYLYLILSNLNSYSNFQVNGESVISGLPGASTGTLLFMLNNLNTSSGHVLQDYNGDGVFGEIAPGDTIIITFDLLLDSSKLADCPGSFSGNQIFGNIRYYQTNCTAAPLITTPSFSNSYSNNNFAPPSINVIGTIADGTSQTIEFCIDRFIFESGTPGIGQIVLDDEILAGANILLPCGMDLVNPTSAIWEFASGGTIPVVIGTTASGAGTLVNFESVPGQIPITSNHINGCLILETTYACDTCSSPASIFYNAYGTFENCSAIHNWSCETISFCTDCEAVVDCSALGRINHTGFEVNRTSFGWTSSAMTTKLTQSNVDINPGLYNTAGAYACDTIRVLLEGVVCGGVDSFTPSIAYEKPAGVTGALLDLANAQININGTITGTTVVSSVDMGTFWLIEFETESGPFVDATTLELEAFLSFQNPLSLAPFPVSFDLRNNGCIFY